MFPFMQCDGPFFFFFFPSSCLNTAAGRLLSHILASRLLSEAFVPEDSEGHSESIQIPFLFLLSQPCTKIVPKSCSPTATKFAYLLKIWIIRLTQVFRVDLSSSCVMSQALCTWVWGFSAVRLCRSLHLLSGEIGRGSVGGQMFSGLYRSDWWVQVSGFIMLSAGEASAQTEVLQHRFHNALIFINGFLLDDHDCRWFFSRHEARNSLTLLSQSECPGAAAKSQTALPCLH